MTKPQLVKVEALFYVLQQVTKRDCAYFDTAPRIWWVLNCSSRKSPENCALSG